MELSPIMIDHIFQTQLGSFKKYVKYSDEWLAGIWQGLSESFNFGKIDSDFYGTHFNAAYDKRVEITRERQRYNDDTKEYTEMTKELRIVNNIL
jgi:diadenosine tetraphosphatase ApaH/serine/threonine PP2A family protein phosphatase